MFTDRRGEIASPNQTSAVEFGIVSKEGEHMNRAQLELELFEARQSWVHAETQEQTAYWLSEVHRIENLLM